MQRFTSVMKEIGICIRSFYASLRNTFNASVREPPVFELHVRAVQIIERPATAIVVCSLVVTWFVLNSRQLGYANVGLSYERAINHGEVSILYI